MQPGRKSKADAPLPPRASGAELSHIAAQWHTFRVLYPVYAELSSRFRLGPACEHLESPINRAGPEVLRDVETWFSAVDERSEAWQLRQLLQTTSAGTDEAVSALLTRSLSKQNKTAEDRDKIDFLLVQYLDQRAPHAPQGNMDLEDVAVILQPILGETSTVQPDWLAPLDRALEELGQCRSLRDLLERGLIERVRAMKENAGQMFYGTAVLLAFTRFNFLMRRAFFRCLHDDLQAVRRQLRELEMRGIETVDCTRARLSATEPLERVRDLCARWKQPFGAPYAAGHGLEQVLEIRGAVQAALDAQAVATAAVGNPAAPSLSVSEASPCANRRV